mmetsp:Transcript_56057/g.121215  ORF Transcript_56057/g.121215 Transcript_56057/m.121215 type:complete len:131 (+) Transcript_56057:155-547(+)
MPRSTGDCRSVALANRLEVELKFEDPPTSLAAAPLRIAKDQMPSVHQLVNLCPAKATWSQGERRSRVVGFPMAMLAREEYPKQAVLVALAISAISAISIYPHLLPGAQALRNLPDWDFLKLAFQLLYSAT